MNIVDLSEQESEDTTTNSLIKSSDESIPRVTTPQPSYLKIDNSYRKTKKKKKNKPQVHKKTKLQLKEMTLKGRRLYMI